jgi:transglutaminase-like putative cysteine protease
MFSSAISLRDPSIVFESEAAGEKSRAFPQQRVRQDAYARSREIPTHSVPAPWHKGRGSATMPHPRDVMDIRFGYQLAYSCTQPVPMILMLHAHQSRSTDLLQPDRMITDPEVPLDIYTDAFGNTCTRILVPAGGIRLTADALIRDMGHPDPTSAHAQEYPVEALPHDVLAFLLGSRYCETERLMEEAWRLFDHVAPGWSRVQAVCDFVHQHIAFGYDFARPTKTAVEAYTERQGVCRDYAHLAITLLRCLNIPARYCTGYLGDIGVPVTDAVMDFSGWLEAYIGGAWHTFDPRNNQRRIGRILIARGRDAADVAISTAFGLNTLQEFRVWTDDVSASGAFATLGWLDSRTRFVG